MINSRRKGYIGEHNLEKILNEKGLKVKRVPLSGADKFITRKKLNSLFYDVLKDFKIAFFKEDRKKYFVVLDLDYFIKLIKGGDYVERKLSRRKQIL